MGATSISAVTADCGVRHRNKTASVDRLVGSGRKTGRHVEAEVLRGLEFDHRLVLDRRLHRKVARLRTLGDEIDIDRRSVWYTHGAAVLDKVPLRYDDGISQGPYFAAQRDTGHTPSDGQPKGEANMKRGTTMLSAFAVVLALALAGCVSQQKYNEVEQQNQALNQKNATLEEDYKRLNQSMSAEVRANKMQISRQQNAIKILVNDDLLFPSGGWEMSAEAKQTIAKIAAILAPHQTTKIVVNGYTDSTPIGPGLQAQGITSNLILSQKRAEDVMQYMISQGVKPNLASAHGFGDSNPVASNDTPEGRAQNRRVEVTLSGTGS